MGILVGHLAASARQELKGVFTKAQGRELTEEELRIDVLASRVNVLANGIAMSKDDGSFMQTHRMGKKEIDLVNTVGINCIKKQGWDR